MTRTISRTTAALAATLGVTLLGLASGFAEHVMREAYAGASRAALSHPARAWDDLPPPATETVWCVNDDAIYAACGDRSDRIRPELQY